MKKFLFLIGCALLPFAASAQADSLFKATDAAADSVYNFPDEQAQFPGGSAAFTAYVQKNLHYPPEERANGKQGVVYVSFIVEKDGSISSVQTIKAVPGAPGLSKEAERMISEMPNWTPARVKGKLVRVSYTQPVRFALQGKTRKR